MIFIIGTRSSTCQGIQTGYSCPACGKEHSVYAVPQQRYFHIFWIPLFPTSKSFTMVCSQCGGLFAPSPQMPLTKETRQQAKTPKWTFSGLFFIIILLASFLLFGKCVSDDRKAAAIAKIENPDRGDIYQVKSANKEFTLYKVASKSNDSIYFYPHEYAVNKKRGLDELKANEFLDDSDEYIEGFSKAELKADVESGKIIKIN